MPSWSQRGGIFFLTQGKGHVIPHVQVILREHLFSINHLYSLEPLASISNADTSFFHVTFHWAPLGTSVQSAPLVMTTTKAAATKTLFIEPWSLNGTQPWSAWARLCMSYTGMPKCYPMVSDTLLILHLPFKWMLVPWENFSWFKIFEIKTLSLILLKFLPFTFSLGGWPPWTGMFFLTWPTNIALMLLQVPLGSPLGPVDSYIPR